MWLIIVGYIVINMLKYNIYNHILFEMQLVMTY